MKSSLAKAIAMASIAALGGVTSGCRNSGGGPVTLGDIGNLSVSAGFNLPAAGQPCSPNTSGVVSFTAEPQQLTSSNGVTDKQGKTATISDTSTEIGRDIEGGFAIHGCTATADFLNLASGTWKVTAGGAGVQRTECTATVTKQGETKLKVWAGQCTVE